MEIVEGEWLKSNNCQIVRLNENKLQLECLETKGGMEMTARGFGKVVSKSQKLSMVVRIWKGMWERMKSKRS